MSILSKVPNRIICAELEMGSSSVIPCIILTKRIFKVSMIL